MIFFSISMFIGVGNIVAVVYGSIAYATEKE